MQKENLKNESKFNPITIVMIGLEKTIKRLNVKYNFDIDMATEFEKQLYKDAIKNWDAMNAKRNQIKSNNFLTTK